MSQPNFEKLITKAKAIRSAATKDASAQAEPVPILPGVRDLAIKPSANLLEILHARKLRAALAQQVVRLEEQSCAVSWCVGMAEFEPLYCDTTLQPMRDPLNADEVRSHYLDLLVALDHLLLQLGDAAA